MLKTFKISLDIQNSTNLNNTYHQSFSFSQNDLNTIEISINLKKNNQPLDITGSTARLVIKKPSKLTVIQDCTVIDSKNGKLNVILDTQAYNEPGLHEAEVYLYEGAEVLVPGRFSYISNDAILNDKTVESSNEWQSINDAFIKIDDSVLQINNNSIIPTYSNGVLTKVEEKDGSVVKLSSTITYNPDGTVNTITEVVNGKTVVLTLNYINGEFSSVSKAVL